MTEMNVELNSASSAKAKSFFIVILGFMVAFVGNYPQFQLSPLSSIIIEDLHLTQSQFISVFSASMIPGILLSLVSGVLCDKFGVKKCIGITGIIVSLGLVGRMGAYNYQTLLICMIMTGVAATFLNSNVSKLLSKWFAPEKMGAMIGLVLAGTPMAQLVGMSTTAYFPSVKTAYLAAAILSIIVAVCWILFAKEAPYEVNVKTKENNEEKKSLLDTLKVVMSNKYIWILGFSLLFMMGSIIALSSFLPLALQAVHGFSVPQAGSVTSIVMLGSLVGTVIGPVICEKCGSVKMYVFISAVLAGLGTAFAISISSLPLMMAVFFVVGFTSNSIIPIMLSVVMRLKGIDFEIAGTAGGVVATIQLVGAVVIPSYIISPIAGENFAVYFMLAGISAALCGVIALALPKMER